MKSRSLVHALALVLVGCAAVPATPGGPLQPAGTLQVSETQVYDVSRARVDTEDGTSARGLHWDAGGALVGGWAAFPVRLGGRVAITDWLDAAADWNLSVSGLEVRAGRGEGVVRIPFAMAIAARTDWLATNPAGRETGNQHDLRVRFEAYPRLWLSSVNPSVRTHLVLALGASTGRHFHEYQVATYESPLVRHEDRLEGALGVDYRHSHFAGSLTLMPYYVMHASAFTAAECSFGDCLTSRVTGYQQSFGIAILLNLGVVFSPRATAPREP